MTFKATSGLFFLSFLMILGCQKSESSLKNTESIRKVSINKSLIEQTNLGPDKSNIFFLEVTCESEQNSSQYLGFIGRIKEDGQYFSVTDGGINLPNRIEFSQCSAVLIDYSNKSERIQVVINDINQTEGVVISAISQTEGNNSTTQCIAYTTNASIEWCEDNCQHTPAFCPENLCSASCRIP